MVGASCRSRIVAGSPVAPHGDGIALVLAGIIGLVSLIELLGHLLAH
jgi:hypothetical protein